MAGLVALAGTVSKTFYQLFGSIQHRANSSFRACTRYDESGKCRRSKSFNYLLDLGWDEVTFHFEDIDIVPEAEGDQRGTGNSIMAG